MAKHNYFTIILLFVSILTLTSCKKIVEIPLDDKGYPKDNFLVIDNKIINLEDDSLIYKDFSSNKTKHFSFELKKEENDIIEIDLPKIDSGLEWRVESDKNLFFKEDYIPNKNYKKGFDGSSPYMRKFKLKFLDDDNIVIYLVQKSEKNIKNSSLCHITLIKK